MTADTRLNIFQPILNKFGKPFGIYKELTSNTNCINATIGNCFRTNFHIHSTCANNGDIYKFLNMRHIFKITVFGHIHRRMRPIPGVICTVIGIKHIITCILQILCRFLGFCHSASDLGIFFARHCAVAEVFKFGFHRITERYGIILSASFFNSIYDFCGKTIAIFKATAVFIGTFVKKLNCKLVKKISFVNGMNLNAVNARFLTKFGGLCKCFNNFVNLLYCHFGALDIVRPTRFLHRGRCKFV